MHRHRHRHGYRHRHRHSVDIDEAIRDDITQYAFRVDYSELSITPLLSCAFAALWTTGFLTLESNSSKNFYLRVPYKYVQHFLVTLRTVSKYTFKQCNRRSCSQGNSTNRVDVVQAEDASSAGSSRMERPATGQPQLGQRHGSRLSSLPFCSMKLPRASVCVGEQAFHTDIVWSTI